MSGRGVETNNGCDSLWAV